jgi:hypothetical protein
LPSELQIQSAAPGSSPRSSEVSCSAPSGAGAAARSEHLIEEVGEVFNAVTFIVFGAVLLGPVLGDVTWSIAPLRRPQPDGCPLIPVAISMIGTGARRPTLAFLGWFGPRGLASIVFAVLVLEEGGLPHDGLILTTIYVTIGLSVLAHGLTAAPLANRYADWYESHPEDALPGSRELGQCGTFAGASAVGHLRHARPHRPRLSGSYCVLLWFSKGVPVGYPRPVDGGGKTMPL